MLILEIPGPVTKEKSKHAANVPRVRLDFKDLLTQAFKTLLNIAERFRGTNY